MRSKWFSKLGIIAPALALSVLLTSGAQARAQGYQPFTGTVNVTNAGNQLLGFDGTSVVQVAMDSAWNQLIPSLMTQINYDTSIAVQNATGRTIRNPVSRLNSRGTLQISPGSNGISVEYALGNNSEDFYITTPDGLPSGLDPHFSVTFDIIVDAAFSVGTSGVTISTAVARVQNAKLDSQNVTADLVKDVDAIIRAFGGEGFFQPAERRINNLSYNFRSAVQNDLGSLNQFLGQLFAQGYSQIRSLTQSAGNGMQNLCLQLSNPNVPMVPTSGQGVISGTIRWNKSDGRPFVSVGQSYSAGFTVQAEVRQAQSASTPQAPNTFGYQNSTRVGVVRITPAVETATGYEFQYQITNLPTGVPVYVEVSLNGQWQGVGSVSFSPVGWPGYVTLQQSRSLSPYSNTGGSRNNVYVRQQTPTNFPGSSQSSSQPTRRGPGATMRPGRGQSSMIYGGQSHNQTLRPNSQVSTMPVSTARVSGSNATGFDFQLTHNVIPR